VFAGSTTVFQETFYSEQQHCYSAIIIHNHNPLVQILDTVPDPVLAEYQRGDV